MAELTAPFVMKNDEKRIVYGPVLIPDEPDSDKDVVSAEKIEEVAHKFVEDYGNIDLQHSLNNVGRLVESYITPVELVINENLTVPKGSWMMGVRVTDDNTWQAVKNGKLGGFSIMAINKMAMKSADTTEKNHAQKRTTLADLADGWIVNAVSLVDEPAVPKAKFVAIKSKAKAIDEETVQKAIQGSLEHRRTLVRQKVDQVFEKTDTFTIVHSTLEDSVIFKLIDDRTGTRKFYQIGYDIDAQGNVNFTNEPHEVQIVESVVPVQNMATMSKENNNEPTTAEKEQATAEENDSLLDKIKKAFGFSTQSKSSEKAGRVISDSNFQKLKQAKEVIDDLLAIGEKERQGKKSKDGDEEMKKEDVQKMIDDAINPLTTQVTELVQTLKGESSNDDEQQENQAHKGQGETNDEDNNQEQQSSQKSADQNNENEQDNQEENEVVSKSEYDKLVNELEKVKKSIPFSKRLAGQDGIAEKSNDDETTQDRNAFGYKRKK